MLDRVKETVATRGKPYGEPSKNHACTATLWSAYLSRRADAEITLSGEDVCILNILQKVSRQAQQSKEDNWIDLAGYAANGYACRDFDF